jgi:hypothetical protein
MMTTMGFEFEPNLNIWVMKMQETNYNKIDYP